MNQNRFFVVEEDTNLYNIFDTEDFNDNGWYYGYVGEEGYNIVDFEDDIVFSSNDFDECVAWVDKQLDYE